MTGNKKNRCVRLSDEEYRTLQSNAKTMGVSIVELIRRTAIYGQKISPVTLDMEPLRKLLYESQKQGNNLNQLAKEANRYGMSERLAADIEEEIQKAKKMRKRLNQLMVDIREGRLNL